MAKKTLDNVTGICEVPDGADPAQAAGVSDASYLVLGAHAALTAERIFTPSADFAAVDGRAGGSYAFALSNTGVVAAAYGGTGKLIKSATIDVKGRTTAIAEAVGGTDYEFPLSFVGASRVGNVVTIVGGVSSVTAGAGLTGGGTGAVTLNVVANADGSIVVAADDVKVGVLATDAQHGTRGGGTSLHPVVTTSVAGFMSAADKVTFDAISTTYVPVTRTVSTTAPLGGGGALSSNLTLTISAATTGAAGSMSAADKTKIDGLAALTTKGDLLGFSTVALRLPVGSDGQVLTADAASAAGVKWAAASGGGAPTTSKYIVQGTTDASLPNAQFLGALATGIVKNATTTGVLSIATGGTDYEFPLTFTSGLTRSTNTVSVTTNGITNAMIRQGGARTVIGVAGSSTANVADIAGAGAKSFLADSGSGLSFRTLVAADIQGGTTKQILFYDSSGLASSSADLLYDSTTHDLTLSVAESGGEVAANFTNSSNTANSHTSVNINVAGASGGNPGVLWSVSGGGSFRAYVENSASDVFRFVPGTTYPGTGNTASWSFDSTGYFCVGRTSPSTSLAGIGTPLIQAQSISAGSANGFASTNGSSTGITGLGIQAAVTTQLLTVGSAFAGTFFGLTAASLSYLSGGGVLTMGTTVASPTYLMANSVQTVVLQTNGNIGFNPTITSGADASTFGGMVKGVFEGHATTAPSSDPTNGWLRYGDATGYYLRGPSGTITKIAIP